MKRIVYSTFTKFMATVLFLASLMSAASFAIDGLAQYTGEESSVYSFENSFDNTTYFSWMLVEPVEYLRNAFIFYENEKEEYIKEQESKVTGENGDMPPEVFNLSSGEPVETVTQETDPEDLFAFKLPTQTNLPNIPVFSKDVYDYIEKELASIYNIDKINYNIKVGERVFTNNPYMTQEDYMSSRFFIVGVREENGYADIISESGANYHGMFYELRSIDAQEEILYCVSIKEEFVKECEEIWLRQEGYIKDIFNKCFGYVCIALLLFVYLICVCGRKYDGEATSSWVDNMWTEVHIAAIPAFSALTVAVVYMVLEHTLRRSIPLYMGKSVILLCGAVGVLLVLNSILSLIRKIKHKTFAKDSVIIKTVKVIFKIVTAFLRCLRDFFKYVSQIFYKKSVLIFVTLLLVYTAFIGICGIFTLETRTALVIGTLAFLAASFFVAFRGRDLDEIRKGAEKIHSGELSYKIPSPKSEDLKELADNINDIARGLDESVSAKMKAEKLKTDLITNVSHDLKTPLTSIISYTELLSKVEDLPDEAKDYIGIIAKKSDRLKSLTQDLFDISKVQSGNESVKLEKIDVSLLINQSLAEHDGEIEKSGLAFCVNVGKELFITADGRKMSRVMSNLISNALKYTMSGTRVFICADEKDGRVTIELKNISSYPMDFDVEEITARFVRGDESRTTDGNGLGLAIAKSYTEACGGSFSIVTDGDLFKVIIEFAKA